MKEAPDVLFLQETCLHARQWDFCKYKLGFTNRFIVDCVGHSGSLALLWKDHFDLSIINYSRNHIHAKIRINNLDGGKWLIIGVYGHPEFGCREEVWSLIKSLSY